MRYAWVLIHEHLSNQSVLFIQTDIVAVQRVYYNQTYNFSCEYPSCDGWFPNVLIIAIPNYDVLSCVYCIIPHILIWSSYMCIIVHMRCLLSIFLSRTGPMALSIRNPARQ